jgi:pantetheine-phosphate adenylyltransferase
MTAAARHAVFPGTFDPVTLGHLDVVRRAAALFERLTIAVASHPTKTELLPVAVRLELLRKATASLGNVSVASVDGLTVEGCRALGAGAIVRGLRNVTDFEYEAQMARSNKALAPELETVFLASAPEHVHISSTLVRQVAAMGGPLRAFVPDEVARALREHSRGGPFPAGIPVPEPPSDPDGTQR